MYVIMRPPGVCPQTIKVGDAYQNYLKTVWNIVTKNQDVIKNSGTVMIELANEPVKLLNQYGQDTETAMRDFFQQIKEKLVFKKVEIKLMNMVIYSMK